MMIELDRQELEAAVRQALKDLWKTTALSRSPLLEFDVVRHRAEQMGTALTTMDLVEALRETLRQAIDALKPQKPERIGARPWRAYHLLHYVYWEEKPSDEVAFKLHFSRRTLYRELGKAVSQLTDVLCDWMTVEPSPALSLAEPIPQVAGFVGRENELAIYQQLLASQNLAVIYGFAGVGKTALAAELAAERRRQGHRVIWVTLYPGINTDLDSFLNVLACALDGLGDDKLRSFLASSVQGSQPYPIDARIRYAHDCLATSQVTLCLDDLHLVEEVAGLQRFLTGLVPRQEPARIPLIVAGRSEPAFARGRHILSLPGLTDWDVRQLLRDAQLDWLDDDELAELQQRTEGNAAFVKLFVAWAQADGVGWLAPAERSARTRAFIAQLGRSPDSRNFLLDEVLSPLDDIERSVLGRVALCRKAVDVDSGSVTELFAGLDLAGANAALERLEIKSLLIRRGYTNTYRLHDLVRNYLLARLDWSLDQRRATHSTLADYYGQTGDPLEAAFHHCRAGEPSAAVELLVKQAKGLIRAGQSAAIVELAQEIPAADLPPAQRLAWYEKLANAWQIAGNYDQDALTYLNQALDQVGEDDHAERYVLLLARETVYDARGARDAQRQDLDALEALAETLNDDHRRAKVVLRRADYTDKISNFPAAIANAQIAIKLAQAVQDAVCQAKGYLILGRSLWQQGEYGQAQESLKQAFTLADITEAHQIKAYSLRHLGIISRHQGDFDQAINYFKQALSASRELGDRRGEGLSLNNLGNVSMGQGDLTKAALHRKSALHIFREIDYRLGEATVLNAIGETSRLLGDYAHAMTYYERALQTHREVEDRIGQGVALINLSLVFHSLGDDKRALNSSQQALHIAEDISSRRSQGYAFLSLGHALSGLEYLDEAVDAYQSALSIWHELDQPHLATEIRAGLARVFLKQKNTSQALSQVQEILDYLQDNTLDGTEEPFLVYLTCYRVLDAAQAPHAQEILRTAHALLQEKAAKITDKDLRRSFLTNVAAHREIIHEFTRQFSKARANPKLGR